MNKKDLKRDLINSGTTCLIVLVAIWGFASMGIKPIGFDAYTNAKIQTNEGKDDILKGVMENAFCK